MGRQAQVSEAANRSRQISIGSYQPTMLSAAGDDADGPLLEQSRSPSRSPGKGRVSLAPSAGDAVRAWNVVATGPAAPERDPDSSAREFSAIAGRSGSGGRALWRVDALAVLEADGDAEDSEQEAFSALSNAHAFAIVAGNEVHVLSEDCGEHRATITFGGSFRILLRLHDL